MTADTTAILEHSGQLSAMNASRDQILNRLRGQSVPPADLPEVLEGPWIRYDDPVMQLIQAVQFVGGSCHQLEHIDQLAGVLEQFDPWRTAKRIFSAIPSLKGNVDIDAVEDPHQLEDLDFVVYPGEFAVAENGAVWLTDGDLKHRVIFFITQYLVLVVRRTQIVHTMHEAYAQARPPQPGFGLFLSGPSKTADIEQSLVIGAHGCREMQLVIVP